MLAVGGGLDWSILISILVISLGIDFLRGLSHLHVMSVQTSVLLSLCLSQKLDKENRNAMQCLQAPLSLQLLIELSNSKYLN